MAQGILTASELPHVEIFVCGLLETAIIAVTSSDILLTKKVYTLCIYITNASYFQIRQNRIINS